MARHAAKEKKGIGARVERLRNERGWTQDVLADKMFLRREALKNKELGLRSFTLEEACKLAKLFNVTLDYLVNGVSTKNVDIHERLGLTDEGIEALEFYNMLDDGKRMEVISHLLSYNELLDSLYEYLTFHPDREGYFQKRAGDGQGPLIHSMLSPELFEDLLETVLMRVIREAKQGKRSSWYYSSLEQYLTSEENEKMKLAETTEFKGAKKNAKKK